MDPHDVYLSNIVIVDNKTTRLEDNYQRNNLLNYQQVNKNLSPIDLASKAVSLFLQKSKISPEELEMVVYCSQSFTSDGPLRVGDNVIMDNYYNKKFNSTVLYDNNLINIQIHGVISEKLGDWITALRFARNLINAEGLRNVLVVVTEDNYEEHKIATAYAFLVSSVIKRGFRLDAIKSGLLNNYDRSTSLEKIFNELADATINESTKNESPTCLVYAIDQHIVQDTLKNTNFPQSNILFQENNSPKCELTSSMYLLHSLQYSTQDQNLCVLFTQKPHWKLVSLQKQSNLEFATL